ncbi:unnamed protein product [Somion occarium]|uniref:Uncharacterized protein n=1 Tax=Somion occarium TaxID=3059160 RepID=A0ABP1D723_9APHY
MALNDNDNTLVGARGVDVHPGVANPTISSTHADPLAANFVTDPTTDVRGAGAASNFTGHKEAQRNFSKTAGVVEGRPGVIETSNIDPLNENSNEDDGWANARTETAGSGAGSTASGAFNAATSTASSVAGVAAGAAKMAYGHAVGDEASKQQGREAVWGKTKKS